MNATQCLCLSCGADVTFLVWEGTLLTVDARLVDDGCTLTLTRHACTAPVRPTPAAPVIRRHGPLKEGIGAMDVILSRLGRTPTTNAELYRCCDLAGFPRETAERVLQDLTNAGCVERYTGPDRKVWLRRVPVDQVP